MAADDYEQPDLLSYLDAAVTTVKEVAPNLFDKAHPAGDLVVQDGYGHFVMASTPDTSGRQDKCKQGVWAFLDMGSVLNVLTCTIHGNSIDPARARALAGALEGVGGPGGGAMSPRQQRIADLRRRGTSRRGAHHRPQPRGGVMTRVNCHGTRRTPARYTRGSGEGPRANGAPRHHHEALEGVMAVTKRTRFEVLRRDNHSCRYCGATAPDVKLTVDHVVPLALGGSDEPSNLVAACSACNSGKSSTSPDAAVVADVAADALKWSRAIQAAAAAQVGREQVRGQLVEYFEGEWLARAGIAAGEV